MLAMIRVVSMLVLLAFSFGSAHAASGYVHDLSGTLTAQYPNGSPRTLKIGDTFDPGVTLATAENSTAVIKFEDGHVVTLAPQTRFAVRTYQYNVRAVKDSNIVFALLQGGLRFVTGAIGATNRKAYRMQVGTATIGIRGSDGWVSYINNAILAAVNQGAFEMTTEAGVAVIPAGSVGVSGPGQTTSFVVPATQVNAAIAAGAATIANVPTAAIQASLNGAALVLGVTIPINTPTIVAVAAQAAAAAATARAARALADAAPTNEAARKAAQDAEALAARALQAAQEAAVRAVSEATDGGATLPAAPASSPNATPLTQSRTTTLTAEQIDAQVRLIEASMEAQQSALETSSQSLGLTGETVTLPRAGEIVSPR